MRTCLQFVVRQKLLKSPATAKTYAFTVPRVTGPNVVSFLKFSKEQQEAALITFIKKAVRELKLSSSLVLTIVTSVKSFAEGNDSWRGN